MKTYIKPRSGSIKFNYIKVLGVKHINNNPMTQLTTQNNIAIEMYNLYLNTFDNTTVIVTGTLSSLFERTLTNYGSTPKLIAQSYILSDLQLKAIEFGIPADLIDNLNLN